MSLLDIKKRFFTMRTTKCGNTLFRAVLKFLSIKALKIQSNLVCSVAEPAWSRRLGWRPDEIHSHLNYTVVLGKGR